MVSGILRQIAMEPFRVCTPWLGTKQAAGLVQQLPQNGSTQPWHKPEPYHFSEPKDAGILFSKLGNCLLHAKIAQILKFFKDWTNNWSACVLAGTKFAPRESFWLAPRGLWEALLPLDQQYADHPRCWDGDVDMKQINNMKCSDLLPGHFQQQSASSLFWFEHGSPMVDLCIYLWHLLSILWDFFEICLGLKTKHVCFRQETYNNCRFSYSLIAQPPLMLLCSTVRPKLFGVFCW